MGGNPEKINPNVQEANQNKDEEEKKKESINYYFTDSREWLKSNWGVDNLSTMEASHLRRIVGECLDHHDWHMELLKKKEIRPGIMFASITDEAVARWLDQLYDIKQEHAPRLAITKDLKTGETFTYEFQKERRLQSGLFEKEEELNNLGHKFETRVKVTDDFKEHLQFLREKAHTP